MGKGAIFQHTGRLPKPHDWHNTWAKKELKGEGEKSELAVFSCEWLSKVFYFRWSVGLRAEVGWGIRKWFFKSSICLCTSELWLQNLYPYSNYLNTFLLLIMHLTHVCVQFSGCTSSSLHSLIITSRIPACWHTWMADHTARLWEFLPISGHIKFSGLRQILPLCAGASR